MSAPSRYRPEHTDESDGEDGPSEAEANASDDERDDHDEEEGDVADRASECNHDAELLVKEELLIPRGDGTAKPTPHKKGGQVKKTQYKLAGRVMTTAQFNKLINKPWKRKTKNGSGEFRGGKDKKNHGLALVLDESTNPPVHRLHCTMCDAPIPGKAGQHIGGDKHWNKHIRLVGKDVSVTEVEINEWYGNLDPEKTRKKEECGDIADKLLSYMGGRFRPPVVHQDSIALLDILPAKWSEALEQIVMERVSDIVLDLGRRPCCWHGGQRRYLCDEYNPAVVGESDLREIASRLHDFGENNRTGMDGQLHRISCDRNSRNDIIGLTIRVGRHLEGSADMIRDLLEESDKSILFLGEHGSGKTTVVRDATRILSERINVSIVDTWNEIAGHGNVPHPSIGDARRVMIWSPSSQTRTMTECVHNHCPSAMAIDEIGTSGEAEAARTCGDRGVRMIAGAARGDLRGLIRDAEIRGLVGGVATKAVFADASVAEELRKKTGSKKVRRAAAPVFDIIVELISVDEWHVIMNVEQAVDDALRGRKYEVQKRRRCARSGEISVEHGKN